MMKSDSLVFKGIISNIVNNITSAYRLGPFFERIRRFMDSEYREGLEEAGVEFDMNFEPNDSTLEFLNRYVVDNINDATDELSSSLRGEIQRGILSKETVSQLKARIRVVFNEKDFNNRLKTIIRTEKLRANNYGALEGAEQSGLKVKKWLSIVDDNRTSAICHAEDRKYGSKEQAIPLDKEFVVRVKNKTYRALAPPFHPNCRTVVRFTRIHET